MDTAICKYCKSDSLIEKLEPPDSQHYAKLIYASCGRWHKWVSKPQNEGKRKDKNNKWRKRWKEKGFICSFCGATEIDFSSSNQWHVDHIIQLENGGEDEFENTMMLCTFCHTLKNIEQKRRMAIQKKHAKHA